MFQLQKKLDIRVVQSFDHKILDLHKLTTGILGSLRVFTCGLGVQQNRLKMWKTMSFCHSSSLISSWNVHGMDPIWLNNGNQHSFYLTMKR